MLDKTARTEYPVSEIFGSIDGEGKRTGELTTFIRLYGCNIACSYCDSMYSCEGKDFTTKTLSQILDKVDSIGYKNITLTGGEPLIHKNIVDLIKALLDKKYIVNVETNGTIDVSSIREQLPLGCNKNLFFTIDYKCISSGQNDKMNLDYFFKLEPQDIIKFVVGTEEDMKDMYKVMMGIKYFYTNDTCPEMYISPVFGQITLSTIIDFMKSRMLQDKIKVQVQLHKIAYDPAARGV